MRTTLKRLLQTLICSVVIFGVLRHIIISNTAPTFSLVTLNKSGNTRPPAVNDSKHTGHVQTPERPFRILYWTIFTWTKSTNIWWGLGNKPFEGCEYQNCLLTNDRADYNISDAVLFYVRHAKGFPSYRFPWQKWILRTDESPANEKDYTQYNGMFNATWTYHSKSDIYSHTYYQKFTKLSDEEKHIQQSAQKGPMSLEGKRGIAWIVGRCYANSQRERLVRALQKHMTIDIYGRCGPLYCGQNCDEIISSRYKFYLSFENSLCQEYVTEKLWRSYHHNVIPVVMGGSDYSAYLPKHSYIDVKDFSTVKELANYLKLLEGNDTLYLEYFEWRKHYKITYYPKDPCVLCSYMNLQANATKVYHKMNLFWNYYTDCTPPNVFYRSLFKDLQFSLTSVFASSSLS